MELYEVRLIRFNIHFRLGSTFVHFDFDVELSDLGFVGPSWIFKRYLVFFIWMQVFEYKTISGLALIVHLQVRSWIHVGLLFLFGTTVATRLLLLIISFTAPANEVAVNLPYFLY